jgi:hypothetical protein
MRAVADEPEVQTLQRREQIRERHRLAEELVLAAFAGLTTTAVADEPEVQTLQRRPAEELALGVRVWNVVMDPLHSDSGLWGSLMQENAFDRITNHVFAGSRRVSHRATMNLMS